MSESSIVDYAFSFYIILKTVVVERTNEVVAAFISFLVVHTVCSPLYNSVMVIFKLKELVTLAGLATSILITSILHQHASTMMEKAINTASNVTTL